MHIDHRESGAWHWHLGHPKHQPGEKHVLWNMLGPENGATLVNKTHQDLFSGRFVAQPNPHPQRLIPSRRETHLSLAGGGLLVRRAGGKSLYFLSFFNNPQHPHMLCSEGRVSSILKALRTVNQIHRSTVFAFICPLTEESWFVSSSLSWHPWLHHAQDFVSSPSQDSCYWLVTDISWYQIFKGKIALLFLEALAGLSISVDGHPVLHQVPSLME